MKKIQLSETKLNQLATEISDRLYESHYFNQDKITGNALNHFCDHEQINKFLLFQVYQVWQLQISRFKHPYFDFDQPEVNRLLGQLQNLLSRNISIKKDDFKPLLFKAVLNNLRLLTDPKTALQQFFFEKQEKISVSLYEKYTPFFSDFDFVINSILKYYHKNEIKQAEKDVFLLKFDRVLEVFNQKSEQNDDTYRSLRFLKLTNRRLDEVIAEDEIETKEREAKARLESEKRKEEALKAEQKAKRKAEEARKQEEEARRKAEEEKREAEIQAKAEKEKVKKSFFDELSGDTDKIIELEDETIPADQKDSDETKASSGTIADSVKEEEPVWKKLQNQVDTPPTQAEILKENSKGNKESSLMDRLSHKEDKSDKEKQDRKSEQKELPKAEENPKVEKPQEEAKQEPPKGILGAAREEAKGTETILNKAVEGKEEESTPSVLETASNTEKKPTSLVDLLKSREKDSTEKASSKPQETPAKEEAKPEPKAEETSTGSGSLLDRFRQQTTPAASTSPIEASKSEESKTLADKLKDQQSSSKSQKSEPANTVQSKNIKPDDIPIHKQYRYVQKVFGGNNVRFRIIVDKINNAKSSDEVEEILEKYVFSNSDVNRENETVIEFVKLMRGQA